MEVYLNSIRIDIPPNLRIEHNCVCTEAERLALLSLTGSLNWLEHGVIPQASFAARFLLQLPSNLIVSGLIIANKMLAEIKQLTSSATMIKHSDLSDHCCLAFSDATHGKSSY